MKDQATLTSLLRKASFLLDEVTPKELTVELNSHSTGCQPSIYLKSEGLAPLEIWQGSVWCSSQYEFNDRDKVLGVQDGCAFAVPLLEKFFQDVEASLSEYEVRKARRVQEEENERLAQRRELIEAYKVRA